MNIFDEDDDYLVSTPKSNYFAISKTANQNIVEMELEKMFQRLAIAEKMLEERGLEDEHEKLLKSMVIDPELENRTNSLFLELVGNIVTQCE
jgi:flagellin-specific chaperone FliS